MTERFNPLHCGAVVASVAYATASTSPPEVSIPFIAGQWSLLQRLGTEKCAWVWRVSIPFIAGQWSLLNYRR